MKKYYVLLVLFVMSATSWNLSAQSTAFSYQGRLFEGTNAANGSYDLTFALFDASSNGVQSGVTLTNSAIAVSNGLFDVTLDFGSGIFNGTTFWLAIGVRTNTGGAFTALGRQEVLPVPYAIFAPNAGVASAVAAGAVTGASIANGTITAANIASGQVVKSLNGLMDAVVLAAGTNMVLRTNGNTLTFSAASGGAGWSLVGNAGTTAGVNFVGTTDNQQFEVHVNGQRAMRFEPNATGAPNIIGGSSVNEATGTVGSTICGGIDNDIFTGSINSVIAGGNYNTIQTDAKASVIGGGTSNYMDINTIGLVIAGGITNSIGDGDEYCTISGGYFNMMDFGTVYSTISGGTSNSIDIDVKASVIAGGAENNIEYNANYSAIGGGQGNAVLYSSYEFIGGGQSNQFGPAGGWSVIGGGSNNYVNGQYSVVGGGASNTIPADCFYSIIAGGESNAMITTFEDDHMTIAGGQNNLIDKASLATIGGGVSNQIFNAVDAVIAGGANNLITVNALDSTIGGGQGNVVSNGQYATVPGGFGNKASGDYSFAAGHNAQATNGSCFVWNDGYAGPFGSTGGFQFIISAHGGAAINARPAVDAFTLANAGLTVTNGIVADYLTVGNLKCSTNISVTGNLTAVGNISGSNISASADLGALGNLSSGGLVEASGDIDTDFGNINVNNGSIYVPNGSVYAMGLALTSDRNQKEKFAPIDSRDVLARVASLPMTSWNFKVDQNTRHIGPMAQDFYAAFNVGPDDKHIAVVDEGGVALAAIQGLNQKLQDELKTKDAEIQSLESRLARLEKLVSALGDKAQDAQRVAVPDETTFTATR